MTRQEQIAANLDTVRTNIAHACEIAGREPSQVTMIAVSKFMPASDIAAAMAAGQFDFGENYAQELCAKDAELRSGHPRWHFLGGLQSRKVRDILPVVSSIHSVDRDSVIDELEKRGDPCRPVSVFLEINTGDEAQKSGAPVFQARHLCARLLNLPGVRLEGLMCIPPISADPEASRPHFVALRRLRDELINDLTPGDGRLSGLSMGMTADYSIAIQEGATVVRIGTAIFGPRQY